jgi:hypothetical protein
LVCLLFSTLIFDFLQSTDSKRVQTPSSKPKLVASRVKTSAIWDSDGVFVDPDGLHIGPEAIDKAIVHLLLKFPDFVFSALGVPDSHNGIGKLAWGFGAAGKTPAVSGLEVIVSKAGKIEALYTFLDPARK